MESMDKSKKENKGMLVVLLGMLFSFTGMMLTTQESYETLTLGLSILGVLVIVVGIIVLAKANTKKKEEA